MGVWLQSKSVIFSMRDGKTLADPTVGIGPDTPTYLRKLEASQFLSDKDVAVIDRPAPPASYKAPTFAELAAKRKATRQERARAINEQKAAAQEATKTKQKARAEVVKAERKKREESTATKAEAKAKTAKLDAEAEKGERQVV